MLNSIYIFTNNLFKSLPAYYDIENYNFKICLKKPNDNIEEIQCPKFFNHEADRVEINAKQQLCLNLLLEADRVVSSWNLDKLNSFLSAIQNQEISNLDFSEAQGLLMRWKNQSKINNRGVFPLLEDLNTNSISKEQYNLAKKMSDKKYSVCGVDPAGGKTSIALYWWSESNNIHPLMIALPRQHQVIGLFQSLEEDNLRIYGETNIKIEGVFNGKRQIANWNSKNDTDLMTSDINIMVFDRFLSPYYKRNQSSEFIKMLSSHLVLDEFHEFKNIPKMIPSLKEILTIREWLNSGVKTLMLSGTPEPPLLRLLNIEPTNIFKRVKLSPRECHKFKLSIRESKKEIKEFIPDSLYSFLRVESCQEIFSLLYKKHQDKIRLIHSYFTSRDKDNLLKMILKDHTGNSLSEKSVITAKMLQSSYNLSFNKAFVELSQPDIDCQTAGRVNRFGGKPDAEISFFYNEETDKFFDPHKADFKEIHKRWKNHLIDFIEQNNDQLISIRKLMEVYDNFWNQNKNIDKSLHVLKKQQEQAIEKLNQYIPKRFDTKKDKKSYSFLNNLFRGESLLLSACKVNDKGDRKGQLEGEDLISEGRSWFIKSIKDAMKLCLKTKDSCKSANKINGEDIFDYNKYIINYASFGYMANRPLLCSHFNQVVDKCLEKYLKDTDKKDTNYHVYHEKYGLVKKRYLNLPSI